MQTAAISGLSRAQQLSLLPARVLAKAKLRRLLLLLSPSNTTTMVEACHRGFVVVVCCFFFFKDRVSLCMSLIHF